MTPEAPSPLQRALRWSVPGAALLSILVSQEAIHDAHIPPSISPLLSLAESILSPILMPLALITLCAGVMAIGWGMRHGSSPVFARFIILFNLAALVAAAMITRLFTMGSPVSVHLH